MSRIVKIAVSLAMLASVTACTVIPPQIAYTGPAIGVVAVRPAPYYAAPYYGPPPYYRGYGRGQGYGHGYRGW